MSSSINNDNNNRNENLLEGDYKEWCLPWFLPITFYLPMFWYYDVSVNEVQLRFGYGPFFGLCHKKVELADIDNLEAGYASKSDNLYQYGGWGIRHGSGMWNYNPKLKGPYIQFSQKKNGKKYRFYTKDAEYLKKVIMDRIQRLP